MDVSANALTAPVNRIILGKDSTALTPFRRTFTVCGTENDFFIQVLQDAGWTRIVHNEGDDSLDFDAAYGKCVRGEKYRLLLDHQRMSRFPDLGEISDKGMLTLNIESLRSRSVQLSEMYNFYPRSFNIPAGLNDFRRCIHEKTGDGGNNRTMWLLKPRTQCCGRGIRILSSEEAVRHSCLECMTSKWESGMFRSSLRTQRCWADASLLCDSSQSSLPFSLSSCPAQEGLLFYTQGNFSLTNASDKRSYISDYFFTEAQQMLPMFVSELRFFYEEQKTRRAMAGHQTCRHCIHCRIAATPCQRPKSLRKARHSLRGPWI